MPHRLQVATVPELEDPVVEIWCGNEMWAEVRLEDGQPKVQLASRSSGRGQWDFDLDEVIEFLQRARQEVLAWSQGGYLDARAIGPRRPRLSVPAASGSNHHTLEPTPSQDKVAPSTRSATPLMCAASSEARNAMVAATVSGPRNWSSGIIR